MGGVRELRRGLGVWYIGFRGVCVVRISMGRTSKGRTSMGRTCIGENMYREIMYREN